MDRGSAEKRKRGMELIEAQLSEKIIGCAIRVHKAIGPGFLEKLYEQALAIELTKSGLQYEQQKTVTIYYGDVAIGEHRLDLVVESRVVVELKACKDFEDVHLAIVRSYLKATGHPLGLVMNFACPKLDIRRVVLTA